MKFKPDTTIVIKTNMGEVTTEAQRVKYGLVMHRTLNDPQGFTISDPESSGIVAQGETPAEALSRLEQVVNANGGPLFAEKLKEARDMHNRRKAAVKQAIEVLRPIVREKDVTYVLEAIAGALFPTVRLEKVCIPSATSPRTTRH